MFPVSCGRYRYDIERTVELEGPYTITDFIPLTVVMKERTPNVSLILALIEPWVIIRLCTLGHDGAGLSSLSQSPGLSTGLDTALGPRPALLHYQPQTFQTFFFKLWFPDSLSEILLGEKKQLK